MVQLVILITFVSIALAYYFMQKERIRREERREKRHEKQQELLDMMVRSKINKKPDDNNFPEESESL